MKKTPIIIAVILLLGFIFAGIEYLLYGLLIADSFLFYPAFLAFLLRVVLCTEVLDRLNRYGKVLNGIMTLAAVFLGLGTLKLIFI